MFNWRRIAVTGLVAGMVAVTGCSTNLPETNQGNRNGQRVVDSVNRRTDTYRNTGIEQDGIMGRTTRGIRRAANNVTNPTRSTRNNGTNATRNTTRGSNPLNIARPQGRVGNTFRYGNNRGYTTGVHNRTGDYNYYEDNSMNNGYDYGASATDSAVVNNRTTRNTAVAPAVTPNAEKTETKRVDTKRKATPDKPARSSKPEAKKQETKTHETKKHEATNRQEAVTRSTAPRSTAPAVTAPKATHSANKVNKANVTRATRSHTNRVEKNNVQTRKTKARHIAPSASSVQNTNVATKKATANRYSMNYNTNRPNRAARRNSKNTNVNRYRNANRYNGLNMATPIVADQTVAVVNNEDNAVFNNDMAFFRKKTEEPTNTVPPVEAPAEQATAPAPRTQSYNDDYDNNSDDYNENQPAPQEQQPTNAPSRANPAKLPVRTTATRIAK